MFRARKSQGDRRPRRIALECGLIACAVAPLLVGPRSALAQSEDQVKAAFLFNFARYVEWPEGAFEGAVTPVRICVLGAAAFASVVEDLVSGKMVGDRPVQIAEARDLEGAAHCHILFVGDELEVERPRVLASLAGAHVFTVSDSEGFVREGGIANFFRVDQKMRFEINAAAARRAGLKISSRLMRLARVVE